MQHLKRRKRCLLGTSKLRREKFKIIIVSQVSKAGYETQLAASLIRRRGEDKTKLLINGHKEFVKFCRDKI